MNKLTKIKFAALAATVLAASAQAQLPVSSYTFNHNDLLLGFTSGGATADLVIDLGTPLQIGVGGGSSVNLNDNGNVGLSASALASLIGSYNSGGMNNLSFGIIGGSYLNSSTYSIYSTVGHGAAAPTYGNRGNLSAAADTVGSSFAAFGTGNRVALDKALNYGYSWTEVTMGLGDWARNATGPNTTTPASFSGSLVEDLYGNINGTESLLGTVTLFSDGNVVFSAVPEPTTLSLLGGFGLLTLVLRRQSLRNSA